MDADLASGTLVPVGPGPGECRDAAARDKTPTLALRLVWPRGREATLRDVLYAMSV